MNRVQENDISQINFMKYNMQKFANIMGKVGEDLIDRSQNMHDSSLTISSETDIKIFIENNKTGQSLPMQVKTDTGVQDAQLVTKPKV